MNMYICTYVPLRPSVLFDDSREEPVVPGVQQGGAGGWQLQSSYQ